jgi:3-dehydroquinate synthase
MKTISVPLAQGRGYDLRIGQPLDQLGRALTSFGFSQTVLVVSSAPVARAWRPLLWRGLTRAGFSPRLALIPPGESAKTLSTVRSLYRACLAAKLDRRSPVIALGGGVVGDAAGFAAATYLRGLPLVQCPTTLLAMVDSSIGGKTGVDLPEGKNLVGAFWQPRLVWMDLAALQTLPDREWRTGLAEVIKYGLINDPDLIALLEKITLDDLKRQRNLLESIVARSAMAKADVVSQDELETRGRREVLNLGHTFGHAIEAVTRYRSYTHGEAIAIGMCAAARLSGRLKALPFAYVRRLEALFERWGLPVRARRPLSRQKVLAAMSRDKKVVAGRFRFVIPVRWGKVQVVKGVPMPVLNRVLSEVGL